MLQGQELVPKSPKLEMLQYPAPTDTAQIDGAQLKRPSFVSIISNLSAKTRRPPIRSKLLDDTTSARIAGGEGGDQGSYLDRRRRFCK